MRMRLLCLATGTLCIGLALVSGAQTTTPDVFSSGEEPSRREYYAKKCQEQIARVNKSYSSRITAIEKAAHTPSTPQQLKDVKAAWKHDLEETQRRPPCAYQEAPSTKNTPQNPQQNSQRHPGVDNPLPHEGEKTVLEGGIETPERRYRSPDPGLPHERDAYRRWKEELRRVHDECLREFQAEPKPSSPRERTPAAAHKFNVCLRNRQEQVTKEFGIPIGDESQFKSDNKQSGPGGKEAAGSTDGRPAEDKPDETSLSRRPEMVWEPCPCMGTSCVRPSRLEDLDQSRFSRSFRAIKVAEKNFFIFGVDGSLFKIGENFNAPKAYTVAGHQGRYKGLPLGSSLLGLKIGVHYFGNATRWLTAEDLAAEIKADNRWQGRPVIVLACDAGKEEAGAFEGSFAQQLAKALGSGSVVWGPTGNLHAEGNQFWIENEDGSKGELVPYNANGRLPIVGTQPEPRVQNKGPIAEDNSSPPGQGDGMKHERPKRGLKR